MILDANLNLCPVGVAGELFIGGDGLARCYLGNPDLTAQKFIADPSAKRVGARLYRSGDLASWNPDGSLSYHGRIDQQIKLRGYRIEPGEIEAHLHAHPGVAKAVVLLRQGYPDNQHLIAYWIPRRPEGSDGSPALEPAGPEQLRTYLSERLPSYMVPAAFVELEAFPLTSTGKLDRNFLLASFRWQQHGLPAQQQRPESLLENRLLAGWQVILNRPDLSSVDANFFNLGGNSMQVARLRSFIQEITGLSFHIGQLFATPTVRSLAAFLAAKNASGAVDCVFSQLVPMQPKGGESPLFICHGLYGDTFETRFIATALSAFDRPVFGLQDTHRYDNDGSRLGFSSLLEMGALYASVIIRQRPRGAIHLAGFCVGAWVAYATAVALEALGRSDVSLFLFEPSRANHPSTLALSAQQMKALGFKPAANGFRQDLAPMTSKTYHIDPTFQLVKNFCPQQTSARVTVALSGAASSLRSRLYYAALVAPYASKRIRLEVIDDLRTHLDFRLSENAPRLARSIDEAIAAHVQSPASARSERKQGFGFG